jgi:hypothetical protein
MQVSNDANLIMADGAYNDLWGPNARHPWGICQTWAWPGPMWQCTTSTTSCSSQPRVTTGNSEWLYAPRTGEWDASCGRTPVTSTPRPRFLILWFSGNSPTSLHWCDRSPGGGQLASHNRVQVRVTSLYRVPENSVRSAITMRLSWSLVGLLNRHPTCWSSYFMGRVPHRFSCSPTIYGSTP